jgi:hypothetical protein
VLRGINAPRMTAWRVVCGIAWAAIAVGFGIGAIVNAAASNVGEFAVGLVIALLSGWYDYRIRTLRGRRLFLVI